MHLQFFILGIKSINHYSNIVVVCGKHWAKQSVHCSNYTIKANQSCCFWSYMCQKLFSENVSSSFSRVLGTLVKMNGIRFLTTEYAKKKKGVYLQKWGRNCVLTSNSKIFVGVRAFLLPITQMVKTINEISFLILRPRAIKMNHLALDPCS